MTISPSLASVPDDPSPAAIDAWIRRVYEPHGTLADLLSALVPSLINRWSLRSLSLVIDDQGAWQAQRREGRIEVEERSPVSMPASRGAATDASEAADERGSAHPIVYAGVLLGRLSLAWQAGLPPTASTASALTHLCGWLGHLCHRHRVDAWARSGRRPLRLLVGASPALARLEAFVERASRSELPVLLRGELGTEMAWAATAIHVGSRRRSGPLVEVHCAHPLEGPSAWLQRARGGTLFLDGIDELPPRLQTELLASWLAAREAFTPAGAPERARLAEESSVRLVAATTADLRRPGEVPMFSRALHAELDYLFAELPALCERRDDVPRLVEAALARMCREGEAIRIEVAAVKACQAYGWPGNVAELDRAMACLVALADRPVISLDDLHRHTPWLLPTRTETRPPRTDGVRDDLAAGDSALDDRTLDDQALDDDMPAAVLARTDPARGRVVLPASGPLRPLAPSTATGLTAAPRSAAQWVAIVLERQVRVLDTVHPGLRRALVFLSEHFAEPVSLTDLADQAHVSASHLTYLFRSSLGMSFKSFLLCIRIHIAQELLREPQLRITEVALRAGFADLSHFERCFRRAVGRSAREHRRAMSAGE